MSIPKEEQDSFLQDVEGGCVMQLNDFFFLFDLLYFIWFY